MLCGFFNCLIRFFQSLVPGASISRRGFGHLLDSDFKGDYGKKYLQGLAQDL